MAKRIDRDLGQEIFIDEMKRSEAKGDLPSARVRVPETLPHARYEGFRLIQDPTGSGKTPDQVLDHLESKRQKSIEASKRAYGVDRPGDDEYGGARKFGVTDQSKPAWLRDGLQRLGIMGPSEDIMDPNSRRVGKSQRDDPLMILERVGRGEIKHPNPKIQADTLRLYRRYKADPSYDYYGYESEEQSIRMKEEFPPSEDETLMNSMRKK